MNPACTTTERTIVRPGPVLLGKLRLNQPPLFFDYYRQISFEHVIAMVGCTSRKEASARICVAVPLALCFAGSPAAAQSIGSAYTEYDTKLRAAARRET
jgi:hypothetical protein